MGWQNIFKVSRKILLLFLLGIALVLFFILLWRRSVNEFQAISVDGFQTISAVEKYKCPTGYQLVTAIVGGIEKIACQSTAATLEWAGSGDNAAGTISDTMMGGWGGPTAIPKVCAGLGTPAPPGPNENMMSYTKDECDALSGNHDPVTGNCGVRNGEGSYTWACRGLSVANTLVPPISALYVCPAGYQLVTATVGGVEKNSCQITEYTLNWEGGGGNDPSLITGMMSGGAYGDPAIPKVCAGLGTPATSGEYQNMVLYTQEECDALGGLRSPSGECRSKGDEGSYTWNCRGLSVEKSLVAPKCAEGAYVLGSSNPLVCIHTCPSDSDITTSGDQKVCTLFKCPEGYMQNGKKCLRCGDVERFAAGDMDANNKPIYHSKGKSCISKNCPVGSGLDYIDDYPNPTTIRCTTCTENQSLVKNKGGVYQCINCSPPWDISMLGGDIGPGPEYIQKARINASSCVIPCPKDAKRNSEGYCMCDDPTKGIGDNGYRCLPCPANYTINSRGICILNPNLPASALSYNGDETLYCDSNYDSDNGGRSIVTLDTTEPNKKAKLAIDKKQRTCCASYNHYKTPEFNDNYKNDSGQVCLSKPYGPTEELFFGKRTRDGNLPISLKNVIPYGQISSYHR